MRSFAIALFIFGTLPFILMNPHVGLYVYSWISYMNPHRLTWGFAYDFPFAFITGGTMILAWLISRDPKKLPINAGTVLLILFTLWLCVTTAFALDFEEALDKWKQVMKILVVTLLTIIIIYDRKRLDWLIWVIVGSIGYFAVKGGIFAVLTGGAHRIWGPPQSLIAENNALALATVMILPLVRYLQLNAANPWLRRALFACIPIMVFSALASYSRGALIAMCAMAVFLWLKSRHKLALGVAILLMLAISANFMPDEWFNRMDTLNTYEEDASAMSRINAWTFALGFAMDNPVLGGGFGVFGVPSLWPLYAPNPEDQHNAHSVYLEVLAMHGFPGILLFVAIGFVAFRYGSWSIRNVKLHPERPDLIWARDLGGMVQCSLIGFAAGGAFLNLAFFDLFWHLIAILIITRLILERELVRPATSSQPAEAGGLEVAPAPVRSFLRPAGQRGLRSFVSRAR
jgi:probable O-glycosylation ligase (exosortase A-associated)